MTFPSKKNFVSLISFCLILIISAVVIFYKFNQIPKNLAVDEVEFAKLALSLDGKPYIPYNPQATGHSTLYFYILLFSFKIFGITNFALRFPSAMSGILSVLMFYLITRLSFRASARNLFPFLLTIIFSTSHWYFNFARFAFEATFLLFLELTAIYFLFRSFVKKIPPRASLGRNDIWCLIFSGLFAGLAFNSYTPGRIFFLLPLFFIVLMSLRGVKRRSNRNDMVKKIFLFLVPFSIIIAPLSLYLLKHPDPRVEQQFFLKNTELSLQKKAEFLGSNIASIALMFNVRGDINGRHNYPGKPALNPVLGVMFLIGISIAMKQWSNDKNKLFIFYFLISIFPALMTYPWENPNMLRTFTAIPSVVYFIGLSLIVMLKSFQHLHFSKIRSRNKFGMTILLILILLSSLYELRTYFVYQKKVFSQAFEVKYDLPKALKMKTLP